VSQERRSAWGLAVLVAQRSPRVCERLEGLEVGVGSRGCVLKMKAREHEKRSTILNETKCLKVFISTATAI
jgi:hypothetical protein